MKGRSLPKKDVMPKAPPVDYYRKKIGQQNKKQGRMCVKIAKDQASVKIKKKELYQDMRLGICGILALVAVVYVIVYKWLN